MVGVARRVLPWTATALVRPWPSIGTTTAPYARTGGSPSALYEHQFRAQPHHRDTDFAGIHMVTAG
jgi:hypothetical protein